MFSIHGENGRIFRGAMEDLWRVEALRGVMRVRRLQAGLRDPDSVPGYRQAVERLASEGDAAVDTVEPAADAPQGQGTGQPGLANRLADAALSAYAQVSGKAQSAHDRQPLRRVADVMTRQPMTVRADMTVFDAWRLLGQRGVGQAPVLAAPDSATPGHLVGLISRAELLDLRRLPRPDMPADAWRELLTQPVSAVMFSPVPAVSPDAELRRVARVLLDTHLPGLPVVAETKAQDGEAGGGDRGEDGQLVGFISRSDILQAVVHDPPLDLWS